MNYHNITRDDMLNGPGLRIVLWVAGCEHLCPGCQNPITWDKDGGILFDAAAKKEIFDYLEKDYCSGITFSGGDPLLLSNYYMIADLSKEIKRRFPDKTQWLYTGYPWEHIHKRTIMKYLDVVVDGKFDRNLADIRYHWAGSTNQRVIDVQKSLKKGSLVLFED